MLSPPWLVTSFLPPGISYGTGTQRRVGEMFNCSSTLLDPWEDLSLPIAIHVGRCTFDGLPCQRMIHQQPRHTLSTQPQFRVQFVTAVAEDGHEVSFIFHFKWKNRNLEGGQDVLLISILLVNHACRLCLSRNLVSRSARILILAILLFTRWGSKNLLGNLINNLMVLPLTLVL